MACSGVISQVVPGSIAEELGLIPGDRLISVNGETVTDIIDLSFALSEESVEILVEKSSGEQELYEIEKEYDEDLGIEFESAVFDHVRPCANRCIFCFVDQMPSGMRSSLYVKDDDYRLSFLYGNFITLTNMGPKDFGRIKRLHLSPLYISVHTTDGELRARMLNNKQAANINRQLVKLIESGVEFHTQVVLCPGINDDDILEKTIKDIFSQYPHALSLAIVPVGLTQFRQECFPLQTFDQDSAQRTIKQVKQWQEKCRKEIGSTFVYLSDEFYLSAGLDIPPENHYDGYPQLENGVGIVRSFLTEWNEAVTRLADGYHEPRHLDIVCGVSAYKILKPLIDDLSVTNLFARVIPVKNSFFGPNVTVTGLLTGKDIVDNLSNQPGPRSGVIIPGVALRKGEDKFLDELTLEDLSGALKVPVRKAYFAQDLYEILTAWR